MRTHDAQDLWYANWFDTPYYHILYRDRDHEEAAQFMRNLTESLNLDQNAHILDLACGRGRHSMYLNQLGYRVTGVDLSGNSIAFAKAQLSKATSPQIDPSRINFEVHDMTLPMDQSFDAVFNLFTSFGYFEDEADNLKTIQAIKQNLKPGASAVIDFLNVPYVLRNLVVSNEKTEKGITFHQQRRFENGYIYKDIRFTDQGTDFHFTERVRALILSDFQSYFNKAGLELVDLYGNYALEDYDRFNSERLIMVIRNTD
ncbi:MAG: class I SAM-dependent methyltransferase [Nonlabens sp.]